LLKVRDTGSIIKRLVQQIYLKTYSLKKGYAVAQLVEALRYKSEGRLHVQIVLKSGSLNLLEPCCSGIALQFEKKVATSTQLGV
jgi:hypothetical protein